MIYLFYDLPARKTSKTIDVANIAFNYVSEITSNEIDAWMKLLKNHFGRRVAGLQECAFGPCIKRKSLPKFKSVGRQRFVQKLSVGNQFLCYNILHQSKELSTESLHTYKNLSVTGIIY